MSVEAQRLGIGRNNTTEVTETKAIAISTCEYRPQSVDAERLPLDLARQLDITEDKCEQGPESPDSYAIALLRQHGELLEATDTHLQGSSQQPNPLGHQGHHEHWSRLTDYAVDLMQYFEQTGHHQYLDEAILRLNEAMSITGEGHPGRAAISVNLGISHQLRYDITGDLGELDEAIVCLNRVVLLTPDEDKKKPGRLSELGISYERRFQHLAERADIERAIECLSRAVSLVSPEHTQLFRWLDHLGTSYRCRFERLGKLEDIDHAVDCQNQAVLLVPQGHAAEPIILTNLGISLSRRFNRLGDSADLDKAIDFQNQAVDLTPEGHAKRSAWLNNLGASYRLRFEHLRAPMDIESALFHMCQATMLTDDSHPDKPGMLNNVGNSYACRFELLDDLADLEKAISFQCQAAVLTPDGHVSKPGILSGLGQLYQSRFLRLNESVDIDKAISLRIHAVLLTPDWYSNKPDLLNALGDSLVLRTELLGQLCDAQFSIGCYQTAAMSSVGHPSVRLNASNKWAVMSRVSGISSPLEAYEQLMAILPQLVWLGTTVKLRYGNIKKLRAVVVEAASVAVSFKNYNLALEWLEEGRSIVWKQMLQLRTPFDDIAAVDTALCERLFEISGELKETSSSKLTSDSVLHTAVSLDRVAQHHRRLAEEWEGLLSKARDIPGFHNFLQPKKIHELAAAARSGPVVMVNICGPQCDALILLPNQPSVLHVPLPTFSYQLALELHAQLGNSLASAGLRKSSQRSPVSVCNGSE
jgi:tetratricopeptide (TPR) repeat protein